MLLETFKPTFLIQIEGQTPSKDITQEITEFIFEDNEEELDVMSEGTRFWIITEADRSVTTILLPEDY